MGLDEEVDMRVTASGLVSGEAPRGAAGVLEVVETEQRRINQSAASAIKAIEAERDHELGALAKVVTVLAPQDSTEPTEREQPPRRRRSGRAKRPNPVAAALQRRDATHRYVLEQERPVPTAEIRGALRMTSSQTAGALKRLCDEDRLSRDGIGSGTRYTAKADRPETLAGNSVGASQADTVSGRIFTLIQDRGRTSGEEIGQALDLSAEQVRAECGVLIREEEIQMSRRDGKAVYLAAAAA